MWWALECYLKGQIGKALLLYLRAAELGYEAAQSNAAWILEKYHSEGICLGKAGLCTDVERHQLAHTLWRYAAEQGNEHAALLIGDAYFYGRVSCTPLEQPCCVSIMDRFVQWPFYPNV
jgi:SEL1 protein